MSSDQIRIVVAGHTSVGIVVRRGAEVLLIERRTPPIGFALPAGHVDNHGTFENAACVELLEEVGLVAERLTLIGEGRRNNYCRRINGTWHYWKIFEADVSGTVRLSTRETRGSIWASPQFVNKLIARTDRYLKNLIDESEWIASPGLEPVWADWFRELRIA
jgi:8-oxo-dGTP pyrophosphatase MutT (NUDIX family)